MKDWIADRWWNIRWYTRRIVWRLYKPIWLWRNRVLWAEADRLAALNWQLDLREYEDISDGERLIFWGARHPELGIHGMQTFGDTPEEAIAELDEVRPDLLFWMLQDGIPVPEPAPRSTSWANHEPRP